MAKLDLTEVTSGFATTTLINANNVKVEVAMENTLSRDGTGPNQMESTLDMNGNLIINQANPITVEGFNWEGSWTTGLVYHVGDTIEHNNSSYICIVEHTAGVFADDLAAGKWQLVASSADLPAQAGNADKYLTTDGSTASWGGVITPFAKTFLDDLDAESVRTTLGVPAFASPTFTGEPTAPTPPQFNNSTRLATTAFVQNAGLHYKIDNGGYAIDANTSLTTAQAGHWGAVGSLGPVGIEVTLPLISSINQGATYTLKAIKSFVLKSSGGYQIIGTGATTYTAFAGETLIVTSDTDGWFITSAGFGSDSFRKTEATTGHIDMPGGFIWNWGQSSTPSTDGAPAVVVFDKPFTTMVFAVMGTFGPVTPTSDILSPLILETYTLSTATFRSHTAIDNGFTYIAIGI